MPLGGFEVAAIFGATNLDQAFGGAADRADVTSKGWAGALRRPLLTERANLHTETVSSWQLAVHPFGRITDGSIPGGSPVRESV